MSKGNYPGGFEALTILVFLYDDGRFNFTMGEYADGRKVLDKEVLDRIAEAAKHVEIDVSGMGWTAIIHAADLAADTMRGCTWTQWVLSGGIGPLEPDCDYGLDPATMPFAEELTAAGPQFVIPGCERQPTAASPQLSLFA